MLDKTKFGPPAVGGVEFRVLRGQGPQAEGGIEVLPDALHHGKPVEINAYWYNALRILQELAPMANADGAPRKVRRMLRAVSYRPVASTQPGRAIIVSRPQSPK